jgi:hypothetical protein
MLGPPNSWSSGLWIRELSDPFLSESPFLHFQKLFVFSLSFQFVPNSLFKKEKPTKCDLLKDSTKKKMNRCVFKHNTIPNGHISDVYWEIQETGSHHHVFQTLVGVVGYEWTYILGLRLEIIYLLTLDRFELKHGGVEPRGTKTKRYSWGIYTSRIHRVVWGTGTPKDRDEVDRREVSECDGWVNRAT